MNSLLAAVEAQSASITERILDLWELSGATQFQGNDPTLEDLLVLRQASETDYAQEADWHIPLFIGTKLAGELGGRWAQDTRPNSASHGEVYVDGFGNIDHENVYLSQLVLRVSGDIHRIREIQRASRRAKELKDRFLAHFGPDRGARLSRRDVEMKCVEIGILPDPRTHRIRFSVEKKRVTVYSSLLGISLSRD